VPLVEWVSISPVKLMEANGCVNKTYLSKYPLGFKHLEKINLTHNEVGRLVKHLGEDEMK